MWYVIATIVVLFILLVIFSLCKLNSNISREEENRMYQIKSEDDKDGTQG